MKSFNAIMLAILFPLAADAAFALSGDEILKKAEDAMNAPADRTAIEKMVLLTSDGKEKVRSFSVFQKGSEKRMVVFQSPADIKGVAFLLVKNAVAQEGDVSGFIEIDKRFSADSTVSNGDTFGTLRIEGKYETTGGLFALASVEVRFYNFPERESAYTVDQLESSYPTDVLPWEIVCRGQSVYRRQLRHQARQTENCVGYCGQVQSD